VITLEAVDWMLDVHFKATFVLSQLVCISMEGRGYGRITKISSNLAYKGAPGLARYSAAQAARSSASRERWRRRRRHRGLSQRHRARPDGTRLNDTLSEEWKAWKVGNLPLDGLGGPKRLLLPRFCWPRTTAVSMWGRRCIPTAATSCPEVVHGKGL
jgi:3-oxoacyl-[acyl-carrier protein] reductase